jgi:hypothetical protein
VGGDVSRIYYLAQGGIRKDENVRGGATLHAAVSVLVDRIVGMGVLIWLGALGLLLFPKYDVAPTVRWVTYALALGFLVGGLLAPLLRRLLPQDGHAIIVKLRVALSGYLSHHQAIPKAIVLSALIHLIQAWVHLLLGRALQIDIPYSYCLILYPLVGTFSAIPISLNGLGLREGGYIFMLGVIGIGSEKGIAFGLLLFLAVAADSLIGGIIFLLKKTPRPSAVADPAI